MCVCVFQPNFCDSEMWELGLNDNKKWPSNVNLKDFMKSLSFADIKLTMLVVVMFCPMTSNQNRRVCVHCVCECSLYKAVFDLHIAGFVGEESEDLICLCRKVCR